MVLHYFLHGFQSGLLVKPEVALQFQRKISTALEILPARTEVKPGESVTFEVRLLDQDGRQMPATAVQWTASGGTIDTNGRFIAGAVEGEHPVEATVEGLHAESTVVVSASAKPPAHPLPPATGPKRFHGTVELNPVRAGADAGRISEEVIAHLLALPDSKVKVTLEIEADMESGTPENVVRIVTENSQTLKFTSQGFEQE